MPWKMGHREPGSERQAEDGGEEANHDQPPGQAEAGDLRSEGRSRVQRVAHRAVLRTGVDHQPPTGPHPASVEREPGSVGGIDGEADPGFNFNGLVTLQRYAQIDFDTEIDIDVSGVYPDGAHLNASHYAIGKIKYPDCEPGVLLYLKLSYSGDEPEYLRAYRKQCPQYPHEPTSDQFFEETKFEVYRALGEHVAEQAFADPAVLSEFRAGGPPERAERSRPGADEA